MSIRLASLRALPTVAALIGAAAASVFVVLDPSLGLKVLALPVLGGVVVVARRATLHHRALFAGVVIGAGQLGTLFAGGAIVPLGLIGAFAIALPTPTKTVGATKLLWAGSAALLVASVLLTDRAAAVNFTVWLSLIAILLAAAWSFGTEDRDAITSTGLLVLQTAGIVCGALVIVSYGLGHSLVSATATQTQNTLVAGTKTVRGTGPFPSANQAGMVLSATIVATLMGLLQSGRGDVVPRLKILSLGLASLGLVLTGSRASLLAAVLGSVILIGSLVVRRGAVAAILGGCGVVAFWLAERAGTLAGRSLNPFSANDQSAYYRRRIQSYLFNHVDWTGLHGYGFERGLATAPNPVVGNFPNIDEAWLYIAIALGGLAVLGFAVLCVSQLLATARVNVVFAAAAFVWLAASALAENLFLDPVPSVAAMLLMGSIAATRGAVSVRRTAEKPQPAAGAVGWQLPAGT